MMNTFSPIKYATFGTHRTYLRLGWLLLCLLSLTACVTTPTHRRHKTPQNVSVGAGPNRALAVYAMKFLGTPYTYGGTDPGGFDCSGLVQYSAKKSLNLNLPRRAVDQATVGQEVSLKNLKAGDLLFFNTDGQPYSHVGVYLGQTYFVHAPRTGGVVRVEDYTLNYWSNRFTEARRVQ